MQRRNLVNTPQETLRTVREAYTKVYSVTHEDLRKLLPDSFSFALKACTLPPIQFELKTDILDVEFVATDDSTEPLIWTVDKPDFIPRSLTLIELERDIPYPVCVATSGMVFAEFSHDCLVNSAARPAVERMTPETVLRKGLIANIPPGKSSQTMRNLLFTTPLGSRSSAYACAMRPESLELGSYCFTTPLLEGEWVCVNAAHMLSVFAISNWQELKLHFTPFDSKHSPDFYIFPLRLCEHIKSIIANDLARFSPILPAGRFVFTLQRNPCNLPWTQFNKMRMKFELEYSVLPETLPNAAQPTVPDAQEFIGFCNTSEMKLDSGKLAERLLNEQK